MITKHELAAGLQIGIRRSPPKRSGALEDWEGETAEKTALIEAGTIDLMTRAGLRGRTDVQPIPAAPENDQRIAKTSAGPLMEALDAQHYDAILAWGVAAAARNLIAPSSVTLKILEHPKLRVKLAPVLGERGRWLAGLMNLEDEVVDRNPDPAERREWLANQWSTLDWKDRAKHITALREGLAATDEPLLNQALADRRKEVREAAADLLAQLPESAFAQTLLDIANNSLSWQKKLLSRTLLVSPPERSDLPKSLPNLLGVEGVGEKGLALLDLIRHIPPAHWSRHLDLTPAKLIEEAKKSDYATSLLAGWADGLANRFEDQAWADAMFAHLTDHPIATYWRQIAPQVSEGEFDRLLVKVTDGEHALAAVQARARPLSPMASQHLVHRVRRGEPLQLSRIAALLDISVVPLLEQPAEGHAEYFLGQAHAIVDIRKRLLQSLENV